jgi:hypothetical protein
MKYRKLRIAWSVGWGALAALLIALWVRSYSQHDVIESPMYVIRFGSTSGSLYICRSYVGIFAAPQPGRSWQVYSHSATPPETNFIYFSRSNPVPSVPAGWPTTHTELHVATWLLTAIAILAAISPWARWRFSLRTLLIATTLVAVTLALAVMTLRGS